LFVSSTAYLAEAKLFIMGALFFIPSKTGIIFCLKVLQKTELKSLTVQENF
jgi:hypothetical protein